MCTGDQAMVHALYQALLEDQGLSLFVESVSEQIGHSIAVIGLNLDCLAVAIRGMESPLLSWLRSELTGDQLSEQVAGYLREQGLLQSAHPTDAPVRQELPQGGELLYSPILVHGIISAYLFIFETGTAAFDENVLFPLLPRLISQELQKNTYPVRSYSQKAAFLADLLHNKHPKRHIIDRQLKELSCELNQYLHLAVIKSGSRELTERDFDLLIQHLLPILTGNIYVVQDNQLIVLFHQRENGMLSGYVLRFLREQAISNGFLVGVSNPFTNLLEISRFYNQAVEAIERGITFQKRSALSPVYLFYAYAYGHLLDIASRQHDLMDYIYPPLMDLLEYDRENGSDLMDTLFQYLLHNGSTGLTAKSLDVHKNTILYRMNIIKSIMHNDLSAGEDMFIINLSIRILTQFGLYTPAQVTDEYDMSTDHWEHQWQPDYDGSVK